MATKETEESKNSAERETRRDVQFWLDVAMKLTVPLSAILAAWLANHFEQNRSSLQLINQREQAESSLRATMFGQLISPVAGKEGNQDIDPIRYAVLAQLLTLNFHEHFELRPLLQDADERLLTYRGPMSAESIQNARSNLHQAAHRAIQQQIGRLWEDKVGDCTPAASTETTFQFVSDSELEDAFSQETDPTTLLVPANNLKTFLISSPDCKDTLSIVFDKPDFSTERVHVLITPAAAEEAHADYRFDFDLTVFAFPSSDYAVLPNGNRFAFFIRDVSLLDAETNSKIMRIGLRWFPRDYISPTERPTDYAGFKQALGSTAK